MLLTAMVAGTLLTALVMPERDPFEPMQTAFQRAHDTCAAQQYPQSAKLGDSTTTFKITKRKSQSVQAELTIKLLARDPSKDQIQLKKCIEKTFSARALQPSWSNVDMGTLTAAVSHPVVTDGSLGVQMAQLYVAEVAKPLLRVCKLKRENLRLSIVVFPSGAVDTVDASSAAGCVSKALKRVLKFPQVDSATMLDVVITR